MKKFLQRFALLGAVASIGLVGCSKEKQLEKTLEQDNGQWTISKIEWQKVNQNVGTTGGTQTTRTGAETNAGSFTFNDDGTGSYSYTLDNESKSGSFTWNVDNENVSLDYQIQQGQTTQTVVVYGLEREDKSNCVLNGVETYQSVDENTGTIVQSVLTATFTIKKD